MWQVGAFRSQIEGVSIPVPNFCHTVPNSMDPKDLVPAEHKVPSLAICQRQICLSLPFANLYFANVQYGRKDLYRKLRLGRWVNWGLVSRPQVPPWQRSWLCICLLALGRWLLVQDLELLHYSWTFLSIALGTKPGQDRSGWVKCPLPSIIWCNSGK